MLTKYLVASLLCAAAPAAAFQSPALSKPVDIDKHAVYAQMIALADDVRTLRAAGASASRLDQLIGEYEALSAALGGDDPGRLHETPGQSNFTWSSATAGSQQFLAAAACAGVSASTANFPGAPGYVLDLGDRANLYTCVVSGLGPYLWDINLNTALLHTDMSDLDIGLISPAGTIINISTDNGGAGLDNTFNGTLWDDDVPNATCVDTAYVNNVTATPLNPEGRLDGLRGEDPNGIWTLLIIDDTNVDSGTVSSWSLDISTLAGAPTETTTTFTSSPGLALPDPGTVADVIAAAGLGTSLSRVKVYVELPHTESADLEVTLTSPAGTVVKVTTDNGGALDNVFNGTTFDPGAVGIAIPDGTAVVTENLYRNNVVELTLSPEGGFNDFLGEDPNGNWTLTVTDDLATDLGTLVRWDLVVTTVTGLAPSGYTNFAGTTGAILDDFGGQVFYLFQATVSGAGSWLWDLDLTTGFQHTFLSDIDIRLTSPAGTVVWITTDNGSLNDHVFNGTLWDENITDTVVDHTYADQVLASPLSAEGRLNAFRGEDPNGVWTLAIGDDLGGDQGLLASWSLDVTSFPTAPAEVTTVTSQSPALALPDNATSSDPMVISGLGSSITEVELYLELTHSECADLDITLTSPAGTIAKLTTDNGGTLDNVFNGTLFDSDATNAITDQTFTNNVAVVTIAPEGPLGVFDSENPNGVWTLTIVDDLATDVGTLVRWDLTVRTCPSSGAPLCSNGTLGFDHTTACPCGNVGAPDRGCAHSFDVSGAKLDASGSSVADTVILHSAFEPAASFTLFMQHNAPGDTVFHDGVLCAGGTLTRLRGRNAGVSQFMPPGEAIFPNSNFANDATLTLSSRGGTFPGSGATMFYSAFYRNASTTFCPPATANVTNGWVITW